MPPKYRRLSSEEREEISRGLATGMSLAEIALGLGRATSSVSREVGQPRWKPEYRATVASVGAARRASARRKGKTKLFGNERLRKYVEAKLLLRWSPAQVAKAVREEYPDDEDMRISHETIYDHVYVLPRGALRKELISALRREHKYRRKASRATGTPAETRGKIAGMLSIEERPKGVEGRIVPGHWEGDLVVGRGNRSAVGTLVERSTRYLLLLHLPDGREAAKVNEAMKKAISGLPAELAKTITWDQGKELSSHADFTIDTNIAVYFCDPHSPWQRGSNENTNGLLRQYMPKGTDLSVHTAEDLARIAGSLNNRPRETLGFMKPSEKLAEFVAMTG